MNASTTPDSAIGQGSVLLVFDIDGTVCESTEVHERAFASALAEYGCGGVQPPEEALVHYTDACYYRETFRAAHGRVPTEDEFTAFEARFSALFQGLLTRETLLPVAGVARFFRALEAMSSAQWCFATGSFRDAAKRKLETLGLVQDATVLVSASEFESREAIVEAAVAACGWRCGPQVYLVGDGLWDYRAAARLGVRCIAMNMPADQQAALPREVPRFADFRNVRGILQLLRTAADPTPPMLDDV